MNCLPTEKKIQILNCLVEGNSIRSTERIPETHRDTIMRLLVKVGSHCLKVLDEKIVDLQVGQIEVDELWGYVKKKQGHINGENDLEIGDQFQLTTDGFPAYTTAVERAFGSNVDFSQLVKVYGGDEATRERYSPENFVTAYPTPIMGSPDLERISTSYVERQNLTMRMQMRRPTRLTNGFSKKLENLRAAVALHVYHYNFMRVHRSLRTTPAMAASIASNIGSWEAILSN